MPIKIPNDLPAASILENENVFIMREDRALRQDIRPLRVLILNLMPNKITTETQLLRLLGNTPLQIDVELLQAASHQSKNTPSEHLLKFYKTFDMVRHERFDALVVTGAPVEQMDFEQVDYWEELCAIFDWAAQNVFSCFFICWGAQAALYHYYKVPKLPLPEKMFGVFKHEVLSPDHPLLRGFDDVYYAPHSRHTGLSAEALAAVPELELLTRSADAGPHIVADRTRPHFFVTGHGEYDRNTLLDEYNRDKSLGLPIHVPQHYFPGDDDSRVPLRRWRSAGYLLYGNWLNIVYQETPYDLSLL